MLRGGSWNNKGQNLRSAYRNRNRPDKRNNTIGFRLALAHTCWMAGIDQTLIQPFAEQCKSKNQGRWQVSRRLRTLATRPLLHTQ
ncbi:hypothetical protein [Teredinibacter turnerae]|uniref:hypothetical protein n=1 Tax=Teredinibacter turnerae TaxID=2426 RepID=UPI0039B04819